MFLLVGPSVNCDQLQQPPRLPAFPQKLPEASTTSKYSRESSKYRLDAVSAMTPLPKKLSIPRLDPRPYTRLNSRAKSCTASDASTAISDPASRIERQVSSKDSKQRLQVPSTHVESPHFSEGRDNVSWKWEPTTAWDTWPCKNIKSVGDLALPITAGSGRSAIRALRSYGKTSLADRRVQSCADLESALLGEFGTGGRIREKRGLPALSCHTVIQEFERPRA